jgi:hypothetical protein
MLALSFVAPDPIADVQPQTHSVALSTRTSEEFAKVVFLPAGGFPAQPPRDPPLNV